MEDNCRVDDMAQVSEFVSTTAYNELLALYAQTGAELADLKYERDQTVALGHLALDERDAAIQQRDRARSDRHVARDERDRAYRLVDQAQALLVQATADAQRLNGEIRRLTLQVEQLSGSFAAAPVRRRLRAILVGAYCP